MPGRKRCWLRQRGEGKVSDLGCLPLSWFSKNIREISGMALTRTLIFAPILSFGMSACCAPDACYVAQSRFAELAPVVDRLVGFEDEYGYFPAALEDAFPEGLPPGISQTDAGAGVYKFRLAKGDFSTFTYASVETSGSVSPTQKQNSSTKGHYALEFNYVGGGLISSMMDCSWATNRPKWTCYGYM